MSEKILGIDFGTVRIGLAISVGTLAEPLKIIPNQTGVIEQIAEIAKENKVTKIVFGISEGEMEQKTRAFAEMVRAATRLPIDFMDETLSSHEIGEMMKRKSLMKRKEPIDHLAAALILENYLSFGGES